LIASFLICTNACDDKTVSSINSCLNQKTSFSFEIIIVANGHNRREIYRNLTGLFGKKVKIIMSNLQGLAKNLNEGLKYCIGEYILRFDADDICLEDRVQKQISFMLKNQNVDVSYGDATIINDNGEEIGNYQSANNKNFWFLVFRNYVNHPSVCFKKSVVDVIDGYRERAASEDYDLWLRLLFLEKAQFAHIGHNLIFYRSYSENGFRKNPAAYWAAAFFKLEIAITSRSLRLVVGAFFSAALASYLSLKAVI
jgi:glycosyltransferase involved in cell wall biosynthesis